MVIVVTQTGSSSVKPLSPMYTESLFWAAHASSEADFIASRFEEPLLQVSRRMLQDVSRCCGGLMTPLQDLA